MEGEDVERAGEFWASGDRSLRQGGAWRWAQGLWDGGEWGGAAGRVGSCDTGARGHVVGRVMISVRRCDGGKGEERKRRICQEIPAI